MTTVAKKPSTPEEFLALEAKHEFYRGASCSIAWFGWRNNEKAVLASRTLPT